MKREPSLIIGAIGTVLTLVATFGLKSLSADQAAIIISVMNAGLGVWLALKTRPVAPAAFTYFIGMVATLASAYGLDFTQEQTGAVNATVLAVLTLVLRGNVEPSAGPVALRR